MAFFAAQDQGDANVGTGPVHDALRFDADALARWMAANVADYAGPLEVRQFKGGQSNPTYQIVTPGRAYVLRRKPPGVLLPSAHAVDREYRVMTALGHTGFPVPRTYGLCTDDGVIGTWFYVMEMVEGRILWDQTLPDYPPNERHRIFIEKIGTLAALHRLDVARLDLDGFGRPAGYMGRQVQRWTRQYRASQTADLPDMERLIDWLSATVPPDEEIAVVHGDFRLDNMVFHPTEPRVTAVLDWELSTLGTPLADFTYLLTSWVRDPLAGIADLPAHGIPDMAEAIDLYCSLTGRAEIGQIDWYLSYNLFRQACIAQGILGRLRDGTASSPQARTKGARVVALSHQAWAFAQHAGAPA